ncbi:proline-rich receptor-like protein kinase PERK1 [Quercus robur]|uniref:proline-rich receptor-like protein kinase PERK1 n=1 Tax=Quercus robur TaxID=38942 RepID=UPI0021636E04|nr:proline-rich receptor-like protein kinase PERK1 [Quercus robur]
MASPQTSPLSLSLPPASSPAPTNQSQTPLTSPPSPQPPPPPPLPSQPLKSPHSTSPPPPIPTPSLPPNPPSARPSPHTISPPPPPPPSLPSQPLKPPHSTSPSPPIPTPSLPPNPPSARPSPHTIPPPTPPASPSLPSTPPTTPSGSLSPLALSPPSPQATNSPITSPPLPPHVSTGIVVGCFIGILAIVIGIYFVFCRRKNKHEKNEDYYFVASKVLPQHYSQKNVLRSRAHFLKVLPNPFPQPSHMSSKGRSGLLSPVSEIPSPRPGAALGFSCVVFTYDQLMVATNGFSEANLLGQGGFGYVHKGVLPGGQEVAVKQLKIDSHQGEREFQAEVETISRVHHKHLVSLVGYCVTGAERLLVYEFVSNKTLAFHLHGEEQPVMNWANRMKIAVGSAKGLAYLHEDCNPKIIHRDIKASNILLNSKFEAKVADFGLAKIFSDTTADITHISTRVVGTFGYLAPEYASSGKVTDKSDVYSYGVMLLELITGRLPISQAQSSTNIGLAEFARPLLSKARMVSNFDALVDPRLLGNYDLNEMTKMVACAAACVRYTACNRPPMSQIVHALEGHVSLTSLGEEMQPEHGNTYMKNMKSIFEGHGYGTSKYDIGNTSEFGRYPSSSSSESHQTN